MKSLLLAVFVVSAAEAVGVPAADLAGGAAVPVFGLFVLSSMLGGPEELSKALGRATVGLVVVGLTAHLGKAFLLAAVTNPYFRGLACLAVAFLALVGAVQLAGRALAVKPPERHRPGRAPIRERVPRVAPIADPLNRRPPRARERDELHLFEDER